MKAVLIALLVLAFFAVTAIQLSMGARGRRNRDQRAAEDEAYDHETGRDKDRP